MEVRPIAFYSTLERPFHSSDRRLDRFVNSISHTGYPLTSLLSKHGRDPILRDGFRIWQQLSAEDIRNMQGTLKSPFYAVLCAGLRQILKLQAVEMDDYLWGRNRRIRSNAKTGTWMFFNSGENSKSYHILGIVKTGSPLSRGWFPWHPRPTPLDFEPENSAAGALFILTQALSRTERRIKRLKYSNLLREGLALKVFDKNKITEAFQCHMAIAIRRLEDLELHITPCKYQLNNNGPSDSHTPLGFMPQLLEQMIV